MVYETDSVRINQTTGSQTFPDSVITLYSITGYRTDSTSTSNVIRRAYTANTTFNDIRLINGTETYTLYVSSWIMDVDSGWSTVARAAFTYRGVNVPNPPAALVNLLVDSLHNDFSGENDSAKITQTTGSQTFPDSVITLYSTALFRTDSTSTVNTIRRLYSPNVSFIDNIVISNTEPYTLYVSSWIMDVDSGWSTVKNISRTYSSTGTIVSGGPSPLSRQVSYGWTSYYAPWWTGYNFGGYDASSRDWAANRGSIIIGGNVLSDWRYMRIINYKMIDLTYELFARYALDTLYGITNDTIRLKTWADSMFAATGNRKYRMDSLVLRTGPLAADSIGVSYDQIFRGVVAATINSTTFTVTSFSSGSKNISAYGSGAFNGAPVIFFTGTASPQNRTISRSGAIISGGIVGDTIIVTSAFSPSPAVGDSFYIGKINTSGGGNLITYNDYGLYSRRYAFDFRNSAVGEYMAYRAKAVTTPNETQGVMLDEEGLVSQTGITNGGWGSVMPPFSSRTDHWFYGWNKFQYPWSASLTSAQVADSTAKLRNGWAKTYGDSLKARGQILAPNGAAYWGPHPLNPNNWTNEARHAIVAYGGAYLGEGLGWWVGTYQYGRGNSDFLIKSLASIKDSNCNIVVGYIILGGYDSVANLPQTRTKINALGLMLSCMYSGSTHYWFVPNQFIINNDFRPVGSYVSPGSMFADSTALNSYTWGKYFGIPTATRDTIKGTDPVGNSYMIWKVALMNPTNTSDTLTFAAGRFPGSSNYDTTIAATGVKKVRMPGSPTKKWYRLVDNSGGVGIAGLASWETTPLSGGDSIVLGNSQWKVYSSDTVLANAGLSSTIKTPTLSSLTIDSLHNDYSGENDSIRINQATPVATYPDSVISLWSPNGYRTDSTSTVNAIRRLYTGSTTLQNIITTNSVETYTIYVTSWVFDADSGWSSPIQASKSFIYVAPTPPLPPASVIIDSLHNDFNISDDDSVRINTTTSAETGDDSVITTWSTTAWPADFSLTANSIRRAYTPSTTFSDTVVVTSYKTEPYTFYVASWIWDAAKGWSTVTRFSRDFAPAPTPPAKKTVLIIRGQE
jgi:hypothetical protein